MLQPKDEKELAEAVAGADGPLAIRGGGTRTVGRTEPGTPLSVTGLTGVSLYEPGALTLVVKAGTSLAEVEKVLAAEGQMLPFEPFDLSGVTGAEGETTIGGVFATNASGARRVQAGAARDYLLGVRFVDGRGDVIVNGGRVMKNVTGYDLVKLMAGSRGTLGILTEISLKVLPRPESQATLFVHGLSDAEAVRAMAVAMTSPFDVTGAVHTPQGLAETPTTALRLQGFSDSVAYRAEQLSARLSAFGEVTVSNGDEHWQAERGMIRFSRATRGGGGALWMVSVRPSDAPGLTETVLAGRDCLHSYDWAGGRIWVWQGPDGDRKALHTALQGGAAARGGHATLIHGPAALADAVRITQPESAPLAALAQGLRRQFDPKGILNPGLMG